MVLCGLSSSDDLPLLSLGNDVGRSREGDKRCCGVLRSEAEDLSLLWVEVDCDEGGESGGRGLRDSCDGRHGDVTCERYDA